MDQENLQREPLLPQPNDGQDKVFFEGFDTAQIENGDYESAR